jgi:hypothetical protein
LKLKNKKQRRQSYTLSDRKEKRKDRKKDHKIYLTTIYHHAPHHMKENVITHLKRQQEVRFGFRVASNMQFK